MGSSSLVLPALSLEVFTEVPGNVLDSIYLYICMVCHGMSGNLRTSVRTHTLISSTLALSEDVPGMDAAA